MAELTAGKPWSLDVPTYCDVTLDQYPDPRPCPAADPDGWPATAASAAGICHLGHPYNCRRYLVENLGINWRQSHWTTGRRTLADDVADGLHDHPHP